MNFEELIAQSAGTGIAFLTIDHDLLRTDTLTYRDKLVLAYFEQAEPCDWNYYVATRYLGIAREELQESIEHIQEVGLWPGEVPKNIPEVAIARVREAWEDTRAPKKKDKAGHLVPNIPETPTPSAPKGAAF